jgi:LCP family protein required for cell wall assembly
MSIDPKKHSGDASSNELYSDSARSKAVQNNKKKKQKSRLGLKITILVFSVIFGLTGGAMVYAHSFWMGGMYNDLSGDEIDSNAVLTTSDDVEGTASDVTSVGNVNTADSLIRDDSVLNILLFGADVRPGKNGYGNSDTMILLSIDNKHQKLKLTSFMRDTWVHIPGLNKDDRINAAYASGGPKLAIETVERNFGVDIDRYAVVDFTTFPQVIDILGGIDIDITDDEADYFNDIYHTSMFSAGPLHMDGELALQYARARHLKGDDFGRTQRQRNVIMTTVEKFKDTRDVGTLANLLVQLLPNVTTNITINEMGALANNALKYLNYPMEQLRIPSDGNYSNAKIQDGKWLKYVLTIDNMEQARKDIQDFIYGEGKTVVSGAIG